MSPPKPRAGVQLTYPLATAQIRTMVLRQACTIALDRKLRALHDGPEDLTAVQSENPTIVFPGWLHNVLRAHHVARYHLRMKIDESTCRWCGIAAAEARAELEAEDGEETT